MHCLQYILRSNYWPLQDPSWFLFQLGSPAVNWSKLKTLQMKDEIMNDMASVKEKTKTYLCVIYELGWPSFAVRSLGRFSLGHIPVEMVNEDLEYK